MGYQLPAASRDPGIVHEFEAGRKNIRARVHQYRGRVYLDLREWFEPEPGKPLLPTKRGISVPEDCLDDLQEAVDALRAELRRPTGRRAC
jgi:hypothetical protein